MNSQVPVSFSLYQRALGEAFYRLPPVLVRFHSQAMGGTAQGIVCVTRGRGPARHLVSHLMRLPRAGSNVIVHLKVEVEGNQERWIRHFNSLRLETFQWYQEGILIEQAGPLHFGFRLRADTKGMNFDCAGCWLWKLRLPSALAPRVTAVIIGHESSWSVDVCVTAPLFGLLARYEGEVIPQC